MTVAQKKQVQHDLNAFTKKYLRKVTPLIVDGEFGHHTLVRIQSVKFYIGYGRTRGANSTKVTPKFLRALASPKGGFLGVQVLRAGRARRIRQRARAAQQHVEANLTRGVTTFDGIPVAKWLVPYLKWARANGWKGRLVSGWRSPAYSESLCYRMCGAPRCPGTCAGRSTNHSGSAPPPAHPSGALDVSDYYNFANVIARCPLRPRIFNALPRDRVHFSATGN